MKLTKKIKEILILAIVPTLIVLFIYWQISIGDFFGTIVLVVLLIIYFHSIWKLKYGTDEYKRKCQEFHEDQMKLHWKDRIGIGSIYSIFITRITGVGIIFLILFIKFLWESL